MNVKNVEFNKECQGYKRKRDRYKEIFGEKPRYIFKKVRTQSVHIR